MKVSKLKVCNTSILAMASGVSIMTVIENDSPMHIISAACFGIAATLSLVDAISQEKKKKILKKGKIINQ